MSDPTAELPQAYADEIDSGTTARTPPQYPIESVDRTLQLIELLSREHELKLSAVRNHLHIGQSTAHRLMAMLVYRGFAVQNLQSLGYRAGPTLFEIGRSAVGDRGVARYARPTLEWLAAQSGETAHLAVLVGTEVRYLDVVECSSPLRVTGRVGQLRPAHLTSIGKAMLATLADDEVLRRYARVPLIPVTPRSIADIGGLMADMRRTRTRGWSRNREEMHSGVCSVGFAVVHPVHGLIGGLSVATPKVRSNPATERAHSDLLGAATARLVELVP